jgi:hypothetical protein
MTSRADFTDAEWERLGRAPLLVGAAVALADPGGPIDALKESGAALQAVLAAAQSAERGPLVHAVAADVAERARQRQNPLGGFRPDRDPARAHRQILDELRAVNALLEQRTTPEETAAFREWLKAAAQGTALAAKEGGVLGFGGERVSENEQQMLEELGAIFGDPS